MAYRSVKAALGHYAAHRKGPKLSAMAHTQRVQEQRHYGDAWVQVGAAIFGPPPHGLGLTQGSPAAERLIRWGATSDESEEDGPGVYVQRLRLILVDSGLIEVQKPPEPVRSAEFIDLNTGETLRTVRIDRGEDL